MDADRAATALAALGAALGQRLDPALWRTSDFHDAVLVKERGGDSSTPYHLVRGARTASFLLSRATPQEVYDRLVAEESA